MELQHIHQVANVIHKMNMGSQIQIIINGNE